MLKLLMLGATSLASLGLLARPDEPVAAGDEPRDVLVATAPASADEPVKNLRSAYVLLRQLRSEPLEKQPRELADRAIVLYRDGIKALGAGDVLAATKLGSASLELAQAVELTRVARGDGQDDELPPPPGGAFFTVVRGDDGQKGQPNEAIVVQLPPQILVNGEKIELAQEGRKADAKISGRVQVAPAIPGHAEAVVVFGLKEDGTPVITQNVKPSEVKHEIAIAVPPTEVRSVVLGQQLPARLKLAATLEDDAKAARTELKAAYDQIRAARGKYKSEETKVLLNAARDLYNAARREAEAGRHTRSLELTRAAMALVKVPAILGEGEKSSTSEVREIRIETKEKAADAEARAGAPAEQRKLRLHLVPADGHKEGEESKEVRVLVEPQAGEAGAEEKKEVRVFVKPEASDGGEAKKQIHVFVKPEGGEPGKAARRMRIETRTRTVGPDGKVKEDVKVEEKDGDADGHAIAIVEGEAVAAHRDDEGHAIAIVEGEADAAHGDDAGPLVGVGLMLEAGDEEVTVRQVLPDGPAAKEGTIQAGDVLVGIEVKDGDVTEFKGKDLGEIVGFVRGQPGSRARLVIRPKDADETKIVEIVRDKLHVDHVKAHEAEAGEADDKEAEKDKDQANVQGFRWSEKVEADAKGNVLLFSPTLRARARQGVELKGGPLRLRLTPEMRGERIKIKPAPKPERDKEGQLPPPIEA